MHLEILKSSAREKILARLECRMREIIPLVIWGPETEDARIEQHKKTIIIIREQRSSDLLRAGLEKKMDDAIKARDDSDNGPKNYNNMKERRRFSFWKSCN